MTPEELTAKITKRIGGKRFVIDLSKFDMQDVRVNVIFEGIDPHQQKGDLVRKCDKFVSNMKNDFTIEIHEFIEDKLSHIENKIKDFPAEYANSIRDKIKDKLSNPHNIGKLTTYNAKELFKSKFKSINIIVDDMIETSRLEALVSELYSENDYLESFSLAREMERKFIFHAGPTNSGKTYHALKILKEGTSGCYLAPLRLLAHEVYEDLNVEGYPTDMITGEEKIEVPDAKIVSSTIEMADFGRQIDVAVIDEIQMIADEYRGWAWTQAVVGIPAKTVVLAGSPDAIPVVRKLVEKILGEELEIIEYERKTKLIIEDKPTNTCKAGDCVVVFSRKRVFEIKDQLSNQCSIIYGSLSPDVRKSEAKKFREGEKGIVVSTDAIGMGLNLPIQRIVFADIEKFNGSEFDICEDPLIKQIAGRAGRFGKFEEGYVTATTSEALEIVRKAINKGQPTRYIHKFQISPTQESIKKIAAESKTTDLVKVLNTLAAAMKSDKHFTMMNIENMLQLSRYVAKDLPLDVKFCYSCAPVNTKITNDLQQLGRWSDAHLKGNTVSKSDVTFFESAEYNESFILRNLEDKVKLLTVYCWLSYRYPDVYIDREEVVKDMEVYNNKIMDILNTIGKKKKKKKLYIE